jgi:hypothetical protein
VVKERQTTTDTMFEPLSKIIDMLRAYGVVIPEESLVQLQELPDKWANTKRLSVMAIQQVQCFFRVAKTGKNIHGTTGYNWLYNYHMKQYKNK